MGKRILQKLAEEYILYTNGEKITPEITKEFKGAPVAPSMACWLGVRFTPTIRNIEGYRIKTLVFYNNEENTCYEFPIFPADVLSNATSALLGKIHPQLELEWVIVSGFVRDAAERFTQTGKWKFECPHEIFPYRIISENEDGTRLCKCYACGNYFT